MVLEAKKCSRRAPGSPQGPLRVAPRVPPWPPGEANGALVQAKRSLFRKTGVSPAPEHHWAPQGLTRAPLGDPSGPSNWSLVPLGSPQGVQVNSLEKRSSD